MAVCIHRYGSSQKYSFHPPLLLTGRYVMSDLSALLVLGILGMMILAAVGQLVVTVIHIVQGGRFDANGYLIPLEAKPSK